MPTGDEIFQEWLDRVQPRIEYIRDAYRAAGVLHELAGDARAIRDDWLAKSQYPNPTLAEEARAKYHAYAEAHESYLSAIKDLDAQMEEVARELERIQDERLKLAAMCTSLNIQELGLDVLRRVYSVIGPDTATDEALKRARLVISDLDAEVRARVEIRQFLEP